MNAIPMQVMDPEEHAALTAQVLADNEAKDRARVAAQNRLAGHRRPEPGDRLFVEPARGLKQRARGGVLFLEGKKTELLVVGEDDTVGANQVRAHQAEQILADRSLNVGGRSASEADAADLRARVETQEAELAKLRAENARYVREARANAKDDGAGGPARLRAAAKARGERPDPDGFGGDK